jgi:hypothetical protein
MLAAVALPASLALVTGRCGRRPAVVLRKVIEEVLQRLRWFVLMAAVATRILGGIVARGGQT